MSNRLSGETSPYLLQHAENPVEWYPWGEEAFARAAREDKPIFLSIGYSTCHWCHVMAHESFEDEAIAAILNAHFISIKVDREERPDLDSIYMAVCQAFTGGGGWPTSVFLTPEKMPFFAGTYYPKASRGGMIGLSELLLRIAELWNTDREGLVSQAEAITRQLSQREREPAIVDRDSQDGLIDTAVRQYKRSYDAEYGGFGRAPKFPAPHNLLFLLAYYERYGDADCRMMVETTLMQLYRGGMFDHIGFGFCRYSTDRRFLVPHFEKMLYDNALLMMAYCHAHSLTGNRLFLEVAEKTADYVLREMTSPEGAFFSAQDADSDGEEGKYYLLTPGEMTALLGEEDGEAFNRHFGIDETGNFEGKSIPNLLGSAPNDHTCDRFLGQVEAYRRTRCALSLDDKVLSAWNGLMIAAMCRLYGACGKAVYLDAAMNAERFVWENLREGESLFVSFRDGKRGARGFLDDYASMMYAELALCRVTLEDAFLEKAESLCRRVLDAFADLENGGFFLSGTENENLILRPKECYDGAMPSGNGLMAWNLVRLAQITGKELYESQTERQIAYLTAEAAEHPSGHAMFLLALLEREAPGDKIVVVPGKDYDRDAVLRALPPDAVVVKKADGSDGYRCQDGKTTYYACRGTRCLPPTTEISDLNR